MEYFPRGDLSKFLQSLSSQMDLKLFVAMCSDLCEAMAYLHQFHVAHCDLKPENVMVVSDQVRSGMKNGVVVF
jgi:serine/threonine protein kinase